MRDIGDNYVWDDPAHCHTLDRVAEEYLGRGAGTAPWIYALFTTRVEDINERFAIREQLIAEAWDLADPVQFEGEIHADDRAQLEELLISLATRPPLRREARLALLKQIKAMRGLLPESQEKK